MLIKIRRGWEIPESEATPEVVFLNRRALMAGGAGLIGASLVGGAEAASPDPTADLYPAKRNEAYRLDRDITDEKYSGDYNNYYEFGTSKSIAAAAARLKTRPWTVRIDGLVEKPIEIAIDDLVRRMPLEERLYRHRCVEAWSMAVPWTGFPLASLVALANPTGEARYMVMQTFKDPSQAPGQKQFWYPWPYTEGLTVEEARNELAFMVTGIYGKPLGNQFGAPLRLAVPWKYGFKSVKAIDRITFTKERPKTFWEALQSSEYGFWANVNPEVPHPRWSQASERVLGTGEMRPTMIFNGYGAYVAELYKDLKTERLWA
ncbi:protein-methionine-sulfoxide reductase catalytic subunit MsrP [Enterovirga aerilata]|uniref:Protein-methionine-sulfoxide reductase catalytic subunit MsrP n=1 Tax=Enterovirga aerilata TaxID=2730920 RepID=A0A849I6S9_9HYPH|nr:protein-methionine-sulfoxide reductase catalytic subunit MsrP [Enterovirga sp. DB1703]NNM73088.1 protein-methionine-sulfoxide reductase catalytic subunit MsrP [Enterovirga sp. DB1703]